MSRALQKGPSSFCRHSCKQQKKQQWKKRGKKKGSTNSVFTSRSVFSQGRTL